MTYIDQEYYLYFESRPHFVQSCFKVLILSLKSSPSNNAIGVMLSSLLPTHPYKFLKDEITDNRMDNIYKIKIYGSYVHIDVLRT